MRAELAPSQRHFVGLPLRFPNAELRTKYVFPFVDATWSVPFYVIDAMGGPPQVLEGTLEFREGALISKEPAAKLAPVSSVPLARFAEVVHFDPWWAFRGIAGVDRTWIDAILASNIAGTFYHEGSMDKVHDLEFDGTLKTLTGLVAKDPVFRSVTLHKGDVDLLLLRKPART